MKRFDWLTFVFVLAFISTTAFAAETFFGELNEDLYFNDEVLIDGIDLPDDLSVESGQSEVTLTGTGTLTVGDRVSAGKMRITVIGGTTITSKRKWGEEDEKLWWEGVFPVEREGKIPSASKILFDVEGNHAYSRVYPSASFEMGLPNEEFNFSTPAQLVLPVGEIDGTKLWFAYKETLTPEENDNDEAEWNIAEGDFCVVKDGICRLETTAINAVALVRELFTKCPRSSSSDTEIENGFISGPPTCQIQCYRGYKLNDDLTGCVQSDDAGDESGDTEILEDTGDSSVILDSEVRPGYFRYTDSRGQKNRYIDSSELEAGDKVRINRQNAALLKTLGEPPKEEVVVDKHKDTFMNYLLQMRNLFNSNKIENKLSEEEVSVNEENTEEISETVANENENEDKNVHSSSPLLPSTGPGIFVGLAALGLGLMVAGGRKRN